jgi:outer membrane protein TolC
MIAVLCGCSLTQKPVTYVGHADLQYYKGLATKIDYANCPDPDNPVAYASQEPRRIRHMRKDRIWDLTLSEALHIALKNNKIIRTREQINFPRNPLVQNPDQIPSIFDPALQETGVLFGQRGVEAALSDFDAQFSTSLEWNHNVQIENNQGLTAVPVVDGLPTLIQDQGTFKARLDKTFADSSELSFINEWDYLQNNVTGNLFPSVYTGFVRAEYRKPLLAGSGTDYTRIAGPSNKNTPGVANGVVIARINNDIAIADFEAAVHALVRDVQSVYWDLSLAYQTYATERTNRENVLNTWRLVESKTKQGLEGGSSADESQALDNFFEAQGRAQDALGNLYTLEEQFRRLLGLPVNDGRVIRPCDEPTVAEFIPDWHIALAQGITRRPEIRKQKWNIKSAELQLSAAKSLVRPRLDLVAGGQINAFGNTLISQQSELNQPDSSAFSSLAEAQQTSWNIGFEASIPLGLRSAHVQVRNHELQLAKARAALAAQEQDVSHEIGEAFQNLDRAYTAAQNAFNRRTYAAERVDAYKAQYELKGTVVDPLLRAQQSLAIAQVSYFQAVTQYNQAVTNFYYRTGTILDESNVTVAEDMWDSHAYADALREAWARSHGTPNPLLHTEPPEFVVPPGKPTSALPPVAPIGTPPLVDQSQASATNNSLIPAPNPTPVPRSGNESAPATPLPSPPIGRSRLPEALLPIPTESGPIVPVSAEQENFLPPLTGSRVTTAAGQVESFVPPLTAVPAPAAAPVIAQPAQNAAPILNIGPPVVTPPAQPEFLAPERPATSALQPQATTWSSPQIGSGSGSSNSSSIDEPRSASGDQFDMPLNQVGQ